MSEYEVLLLEVTTYVVLFHSIRSTLFKSNYFRKLPSIWPSVRSVIDEKKGKPWEKVISLSFLCTFPLSPVTEKAQKQKRFASNDYFRSEPGRESIKRLLHVTIFFYFGLYSAALEGVA